MAKLFTSGCSYTEGFDVNLSDNYKRYKEFRGEFPKSWPEILSEKLGYHLVNYGEGASGNQQIICEICKKCGEFTKDDIVIIGWSFTERYRMASNNDWIKLGPGSTDAKVISKTTHDEITLNRTLSPYVEELYDYEKIIDKLSESIGFQVYYWTFQSHIIYNQPKEILNNKKYLLFDKMRDHHHHCFRVIHDNGGQTIAEETNGLIDDSHMGELGHKVQAELFYQHIINFQK